jgi:hypothetical protein
LIVGDDFLTGIFVGAKEKYSCVDARLVLLMLTAQEVEEIAEHEYNFDQYGEYWHCTVAAHNIIPEDKFFDANEFVDYDDLVNDLMDNLHTESVSVIYDINLTDIDELDEEGIKSYQTMIGSLQWAVSLGRFDMQTATMTMSHYLLVTYH